MIWRKAAGIVMWSLRIRINGLAPRSEQVVPLLLSILLCAGCLASQDAKRGDQHLAAGNWEEASLAYKEALKNDPFDPGLTSKYAMARERAAGMYYDRGQVFLKERQFDLAIEQFKRALTIEPANLAHQASLAEATRLKESRSHFREAERLAQLGRTDEAMGGYTRADRKSTRLNSSH